MSKKKEISVEDMKKALEIEITPKEQSQLKELGWKGMIRKAISYNPNVRVKKKRKK